MLQEIFKFLSIEFSVFFTQVILSQFSCWSLDCLGRFCLSHPVNFAQSFLFRFFPSGNCL